MLEIFRADETAEARAEENLRVKLIVTPREEETMSDDEWRVDANTSSLCI